VIACTHDNFWGNDLTIMMKKIGFVAILFLAACGVSDDDGNLSTDGGGNGSDGGGNGTDGGQVPTEVCSKMDILFVIDDSGSMGEEQANLAQNFPLFIQALNDFNEGSLDYRVAVTTTGRDVDYTIDVNPPIPGFPPLLPLIDLSESGDNGVMRQECGMSRRWLERNDSDVATTFSCVANVGTGGPALEMPLYATQLALGARMSDGTNTGFLREDALLGVIILTDEDDCSRTDNDFTIESDRCERNDPTFLPVSDTIGFLDSLTGDRGRWATAVIAGQSSCETDFGRASAALNLQDFVTQTGENAVFSSICVNDLVAPLEEALAKFDAACQDFPQID